MTTLRTSRLMIVLTALLVGGAVWAASASQRSEADSARALQVDAQSLLTGMLDMESAIRGYQLTGSAEFVEPFDEGLALYQGSHADLVAATTGELSRKVMGLDATARRWQRMAQDVIATVRRDGAGSVEGVETRKAVFDAFRSAQRDLAVTVERDRKSTATRNAWLAAAISLVLALGIGFIGDRLVGRRERELARRQAAESAYRESQSEFGHALQLVQSEHEAYELLRRHLERSIADADVVVFKRNNSADRLEPATRVPDARIAERAEGAAPSSCLAVRLGRGVDRVSGDDPLVACEICGATDRSTTCRPVVVGSEVIGSVLVTHSGPIAGDEASHLDDSVSQSAPALANLRNLAIAETRAATDALTGLPNRRSIDDTLKRMLAQASRTAQPLSALMLDLDHFKTINDLYGHESGDEVLAAVGGLLRDSLRASDFAGRQGGEEFLVLAPATDAHGAETLAENIRAAVEQVRVDAVEHRLSVSIGVATFPDVASSPAGLIRMADRALYSAKERGRNRVERAASVA